MSLLANIIHLDLSNLHGILLLLIGGISLFAVLKGADWLVESAAGAAAKLGIPKAIVGATIVSLGTTAPEVAVSVMAAFKGQPGLALGNGMGSIIADTGLIFGIGALMCALPADKFVLKRQGWVQFASGVAVALMGVGSWWIHKEDATINRWMGITLLVGLVAYLILSTKWSRQHPSNEPHLYIDENNEVHTDIHDHPTTKNWVMIALGLLGLSLVLSGGDVFVQCASEGAGRMGVPQAVIAGTIVALGTSMPELVVGITSIRKGHAELLVGNIIGADILNALFVIGLSAVAAPLPLFEKITYADGSTGYNGSALYLAMPTMMVMLIIMRAYIFGACKKGYFSRWMGMPMLGLYVAYIVASYMWR